MFDAVKIIFFGTTDFACTILQTLLDEKYHVIAAVSQPDRPVGRKQIITMTEVHALCQKNGIPCIQPEKLKAESSRITELKPDLIITCAYGQIVPDDILQCPAYGCLNIHPSLLPKYRGGAPMHRAVWAGDRQTGVCLMEMTHGMDSGRVYARTVVPIGPDETTSELEPELEQASCQLLKDNLPKYLNGELKGIPQDESGVVIARNISREEEQVHFKREPVQEAYNHIRALIDWPIPYGVIEGKRIRFYQARMTSNESGKEPGTVVGFENGAMEIAAAGGTILIYEMQMEGRKRMNAKAFENGAGRALIGKRFE